MARSQGPEARERDGIVPAPLVSVILPVFDGGRFLEAAIRSVYEQEACRIELIVIDDGSTDNSAEIGRTVAPDACIIRQENAGPAAARNRGLAAAGGDYISFIDSDDEWPRKKLDRQLRVLADDESVDVTLGMTRCLLPDGAPAQTRLYFQLGCALYRRSAFERVGGFEESYLFSDDIDWFTRAREAGLRLKVTEDVTLHYRLHENNLTRGTDVHDLGYLSLVKRSLDRRRVAAREAVSLPHLFTLRDRSGRRE